MLKKIFYYKLNSRTDINLYQYNTTILYKYNNIVRKGGGIQNGE